MLARKWLGRTVSALVGMFLVLILGASYSFAADCTGPDDPDPTCTPVASPAPSVTPDPPAPAPSASAAADPAEVVLSGDQFDALLWIGGAVLAVSLVGVVGSWSR